MRLRTIRFRPVSYDRLPFRCRVFEEVRLAPFDLAVHVGQFGDDGRNVFDGVAHGALASFALDAVEHRGVERAEAEFRVVHPRVAQNAPQARQLGFEAGVRLAVMRADGEFHQLEMQVVQVLNQVERMFQMPFLLLAFLTEQVRQIHVPEQEDVLLLLADVLARGDQRREDGLGAELQRPEQILQLPEVENVFGDVPLTKYALSGTPFDLRGYYMGQFRDKSSHVMMAEYRQMINTDKSTWVKKMLSHIGYVAWGGCGFMGPTPGKIEGVLPNLGLGLRIEVQPRMNVRLDFGRDMVNKQNLFYFNMTEAF